MSFSTSRSHSPSDSRAHIFRLYHLCLSRFSIIHPSFILPMHIGQTEWLAMLAREMKRKKRFNNFYVSLKLKKRENFVHNSFFFSKLKFQQSKMKWLNDHGAPMNGRSHRNKCSTVIIGDYTHKSIPVICVHIIFDRISSHPRSHRSTISNGAFLLSLLFEIENWAEVNEQVIKQNEEKRKNTYIKFYTCPDWCFLHNLQLGFYCIHTHKTHTVYLFFSLFSTSQSVLICDAFLSAICRYAIKPDHFWHASEIRRKKQQAQQHLWPIQWSVTDTVDWAMGEGKQHKLHHLIKTTWKSRYLTIISNVSVCSL